MRNRIAYQNVGLLTGQSPAYQVHSGSDGSSKLTALNLVQAASFDIGINRAEVKQIGGNKLAARQPVLQPNVALGFTYLLADGINEKTLGFNVAGNTSFLSGVTGNDDRNFFLFVTKNQQTDFNLQSGFNDLSVLSFGNCYVNNYSLEASVGALPTVSLDYSASNVRFDQTSGTYNPSHTNPKYDNIYASGIIPAVDRDNGTLATDFDNFGYVVKGGSTQETLSSLGGVFHTGDTKFIEPGDIHVQFSNPNIGGIRLSGSQKMHVQSVSINVPVKRIDLYGFGSKYVYDRRAEYPTLGQIEISATATNFITGQTDTIFSKDDVYQMELLFKKSSSPTNATDTVLTKFQDAKIVAQSINQAIGSNMAFTATFSFECSTSKGFLFSGLAADVGD